VTSIRRRILVRVLGLLVAGSLVLGLVSYWDAADEVEELFDAQLGQSARVLMGLLSISGERVDHDGLALALVESADVMPVLGHRYESKLAFHVRDGDGRVIARSFNVPALEEEHWRPGFAHLHQNDQHWRSYVLRDPETGLAIWVGELGAVRGELVHKIVRGTLIPDLVGIPLMLLLVWAAIGSGLRPLEKMARLIRQRDPHNLLPLVLQDLPLELEPMQAALNRLLEQVNELVAREQRFIADAAHELRTPLAVLQVHADNALEGRDPAQRDEALAHLRGGVQRATRLMSQLLTLARLGDEQQPERVPVRLLKTCRSELAALLPLALTRQQDLDLDVAEGLPATLRMEPGSLETLIQNLVGNAIQHCPPGSSIRLGVSRQDGLLRLSVDDSGPGVPPAERRRLSERFFTLGTTHGAGLGLSIVQRILDRHGGRLDLADSPLGGLNVTATLPLG
jgi:two-component system, OmpR family, sensor histidine kinase QseC